MYWLAKKYKCRAGCAQANPHAEHEAGGARCRCCRGGLAPSGCRGVQGTGPVPAASTPGEPTRPHLLFSLRPLLGGSLQQLRRAAAGGACAAGVPSCGDWPCLWQPPRMVHFNRGTKPKGGKGSRDVWREGAWRGSMPCLWIVY